MLLQLLFDNCQFYVMVQIYFRCYITLTTALHLHRGAIAKGPAGSGKTETVKDLGKGLGRYVIVVNCSEGMDYVSVSRMFSGMWETENSKNWDKSLGSYVYNCYELL